MTLSLYAGLLWMVAGFSGLLRHFALEPRMTTFPKAPPYLLFVFFFTSTFFVFMGLRFVCAWWLGETGTPPNASPAGVAVAAIICNYKLSLLFNVLRQRYPSIVWSRLNTITDKLEHDNHNTNPFKRMK